MTVTVDRNDASKPASVPWPGARGLAGAIAVWLIVVSVLAASALWQTDRIEHRAIAEAETRAQAGAAAAEQYMLRSLDGIGIILDLMAALGRTPASESEVASRIQAQAQQLIRGERFGVLMATYIDAQGQMVWSTLAGDRRVDLSQRPNIRAILDGADGLVVNEPSRSPLSERTTIHFARGERNAEGRLTGIVAVSVNPEALARGFADLLLQPDDHIGLRRLSDGMLLARSGHGQPPVGPPSPIDHPAVIAARQAPRGHFQIRSWVSGHDVFAAYRAIPDAPLLVVFAIDRTSQLRDAAEAIRATWIAHAAMAGTIGAAFALLAAIRRRRDVSRQLHHAEAIRREMDELLSVAPTIIIRAEIAADGTFRRNYISPGVEAVTGWPDSTLDTPEKWRALSEPSDNRFWNSLFHSLRHQDEFTQDWRQRRPDGRWMWLRIHGRVFRRHADGGVAFTSYVVDITRERELSEQAAASAKLATLGEMATGLAHELNQPISVMMLAAENASDSLEDSGLPLPEGVQERLRLIGNQGERAKAIIDHLRLFGYPHNDGIEPVSVAEAMEGARILTAAALRQAQVKMQVAVPAHLPRVRAQLIRLEQVLVNLLMNARDVLVKRPKGAPRRLRIAAREDAGSVVVEVADTGGGIPSDILSFVFEPFVTTKPMGHGTGLGLSICEGIVRGFGGTITAANSAEGAVFTIAMPLWTDEDGAAPASSGQKSRSA